MSTVNKLLFETADSTSESEYFKIHPFKLLSTPLKVSEFLADSNASACACVAFTPYTPYHSVIYL